MALHINEPEHRFFLDAIALDPKRLISAASVLEAGIIVESRFGPDAGDDLDQLLGQLGLDIESVTAVQAHIARQAYRTYGKGRHPAALNFGDCFAYALAQGRPRTLAVQRQ